MRWLTSTPIDALRAGRTGDVDRGQPGEHGNPIGPPLDELPDPGLAFEGGNDGRSAADGPLGSGAGASDGDQDRIPRLWRVDRI